MYYTKICKLLISMLPNENYKIKSKKCKTDGENSKTTSQNSKPCTKNSKTNSKNSNAVAKLSQQQKFLVAKIPEFIHNSLKTSGLWNAPTLTSRLF